LFSLGATLYQALTLELPYGRAGARPTAASPVRPSRRQPLLPPGLDPVLLKALAVRREDRFVSAEALQDDWRRVRQGLPPRTRLPVSGLGKALTAAAALMLLAVAAFAFFARSW